MKKLAIAGASLALAAMPVVGVFAEANQGSFTDNISVKIDGGCTLENAADGATPGSYADRTFSATIVAGTNEVLSGVEGTDSTVAANPMKVSCNTSTGSWEIKATAAHGGALLREGGSETTPADLIPSGTAISGGTSSFAYSLNGTSWLGVPTTASAAIQSGDASDAPVSFNPTYRVYVAPTQKDGTYKGSVTYTINMQ